VGKEEALGILLRKHRKEASYQGAPLCQLAKSRPTLENGE